MKKNVFGTYQLLWRIQRNILLLITICVIFAVYHFQIKKVHESRIAIINLLHAFLLVPEITSTTIDNKVSAADAVNKLTDFSLYRMAYERIPKNEAFKEELNEMKQILEEYSIWHSEIQIFGSSKYCNVLLIPESENVNGYKQFLNAESIIRIYPTAHCSFPFKSLMPVAVVVNFSEEKAESDRLGFVFPWNIGKLIINLFNSALLEDCEAVKWCFDSIPLFPEDSVLYKFNVKMDKPIKQKLVYIPGNFAGSILDMLDSAGRKGFSEEITPEAVQEYLKKIYKNLEQNKALESKDSLEYGGLTIYRDYAPLIALTIISYLIAIIFMDVSKLDQSRKVTGNYLPNIFLDSSSYIDHFVKMLLIILPFFLSLLTIFICFDYYRWTNYLSISSWYINPLQLEIKIGENALDYFDKLEMSTNRSDWFIQFTYIYTLLLSILLLISSTVLTYRLSGYIIRKTKGIAFFSKKRNKKARLG